MKYNKLFRYENGGYHKRNITVDNNFNVETSMLPKDVDYLSEKVGKHGLFFDRLNRQ